MDWKVEHTKELVMCSLQGHSLWSVEMLDGQDTGLKALILVCIHKIQMCSTYFTFLTINSKLFYMSRDSRGA